MKLTDLIPRPAKLGGHYWEGYNDAVAEMGASVKQAEAAGYRLALAMPQHIEPMENEV